jgi:hypothetical protein
MFMESIGRSCEVRICIEYSIEKYEVVLRTLFNYLCYYYINY